MDSCIPFDITFAPSPGDERTLDEWKQEGTIGQEALEWEIEEF